MSYTPIVPVNGYAGWLYLQRTMERQIQSFNNQAVTLREEAYFKQKIGSVDTADQLVNDPRLLRVALTAFGLESDVNNKFFIKKVLEDGVTNTSALSNRLANKQYQKLSAAFGFTQTGRPKSKLSGFPDKILPNYRKQKFNTAVGERNSDMRLALNAQVELPALANSQINDISKWYSVLGNAPLRDVFEKAFGLPIAFGALDIDKQVEILKKRSLSAFGSDSLSHFSSTESIEKLINVFLLKSELSKFDVAQSSAQVALSLLSNNTHRS